MKNYNSVVDVRQNDRYGLGNVNFFLINKLGKIGPAGRPCCAGTKFAP